jgi:hypothetical protein
MMEERRGKMVRKKFGAMLVALLTGVVLSAGSASAQFGYLMGDPATGKLIPAYRVAPNTSTVIGLTNTIGGKDGPNTSFGDIAVHVTVFSKRSTEILNFDLCLSPSDFGFVVLQVAAPNSQQQAELNKRFAKVRVLSVTNDGIPEEGYVTMGVVGVFSSHEGKCNDFDFAPRVPPHVYDLITHDNAEYLATWAILLDIGQGFFATEIPTPTANVDPTNGVVSGGIGAYGLIPGPPTGSACGGTPNPFDEFPFVCGVANNPFGVGGNWVLARFDVNPSVDSHTEVFVWLKRNAFVVANDPGSGVNRGTASIIGFLDCEDEFRVSTNIPLPDEVNVINPDSLPAMGQCKAIGQYRGNLLFSMPDTGFLWSQITQEGAHFRQNYLGYNLGDNDFIDCADDYNDFFNDPYTSAPPLCYGKIN